MSTTASRRVGGAAGSTDGSAPHVRALAVVGLGAPQPGLALLRLLGHEGPAYGLAPESVQAGALASARHAPTRRAYALDRGCRQTGRRTWWMQQAERPGGGIGRS